MGRHDDADDFAPGVEQRTATLTGIEFAVGPDVARGKNLIAPPNVHALNEAHDGTQRQIVGKTKRDDEGTDGQIRRAAQRQSREGSIPFLRLDHREVDARAPAQNPGRQLLVLPLDPAGVGVANDRAGGQHHTVGARKKTGADPVRGRVRQIADLDLAVRVNFDHGRPRLGEDGLDFGLDALQQVGWLGAKGERHEQGRREQARNWRGLHSSPVSSALRPTRTGARVAWGGMRTPW